MALISSSYTGLQHGDAAPHFSLIGVDDKVYTLKDFAKKKLLLVVFICNHCPYALPKIDALNKIVKDFPNVAVVGINSNDEVEYPEDSFDNMKKLVHSREFLFPYLRDETQEIAQSYGAVCTPDPFLFDGKQKLVFHSRIDNGTTKPGSDQEMYNAIKQYFDEGTITLKETPSMGCSIKWKEQEY